MAQATAPLLDSTKRAQFNSHLSEVIEPAISDHRGRLVKTTGDGLPVEFGSVVDAVACAADIQETMLSASHFGNLVIDV